MTFGPGYRPHLKGERPPVPNRAALTGIVFVLRTGLPWEYLPKAMNCGSGMTCWRRLHEWQQAGVWGASHRVLLERLDQAGQLDWSRASLDSTSVHPKRGAESGPNPTDRGRPGTKRHPVVHARGTPLGVTLTGANRHDSMALATMLDAIPDVRSGKRGRPRCRPDKLHADKAHDSRRCREECTKWGIKPRIARKNHDSSQRLGRHRWVVERTHAWVARLRRLTVRYKRRADIHLAFVTLGCLNQINRFC